MIEKMIGLSNSMLSEKKKGRTTFGRSIITSITKLACYVQVHKTSTKQHFSQGKKDQIQTLLTYFKESSKKTALEWFKVGE